LYAGRAPERIGVAQLYADCRPTMRPERSRKTREPHALREALRNVYWVGGGSAAGKSTLARRLADRHRFPLYATDEAMADHASRSTPASAPLLRRFMAMDMDERWLQRPPKTMLDTFHWFEGECFDMIVDDLLGVARRGSVIVEGFRLLPRLVKPLLAVPGRAVWLLPTPELRRAVFERRGPAWGFLSRTSDPAKALGNLLERDRLFTDRLREETNRMGLPSIEIDPTMAEDDLAERVTDAFGL
jgi:2-phosphoglycerate kinase